jgi:hypothetical protein
MAGILASLTARDLSKIMAAILAYGLEGATK